MTDIHENWLPGLAPEAAASNGNLAAQGQPASPPEARKPTPDAVALEGIWARLATSRFRSRFHLGAGERGYLQAKGVALVRQHAEAFIAQRLAPAQPAQDGRQTPMRGHPIFIAQHATATCCRGCLAKWHGMAVGQPLDDAQQARIVVLLMAWIARDVAREEPCATLAAGNEKAPGHKKTGRRRKAGPASGRRPGPDDGFLF